MVGSDEPIITHHTDKINRLVAIIPPLALFLMAFLALGAISALILFSLTNTNLTTISDLFNNPYNERIIRFTLWQAFLSTSISTICAIPIALAFFEYKKFAGRSLILRLFALPLALPQIVAVLAIVSLYGNQGYFTDILITLGLPTGSIYGITGILLAHVFFNLPLVIRIILGALSSMPPEYERLAHQLQMNAIQRFSHVYWPYFKTALFNAASLVFMLCITSFTIVLTLGGGPAATTIEVAIYQALTFDFDIPRAVILTLIQLGLTVIVVIIFVMAGGSRKETATLESGSSMVAGHNFITQITYIALIISGTFFVLSPFVAIFAKGLFADIPSLLQQEAVQSAILTSLILGFLAAILCMLISLALCQGAIALKKTRWIYAQAASLILVIPSIVLAAGWFVMLRSYVNVYQAAPYLVVSINAAMALPFAMRFLLPARQTAAVRHDRLCAQLGISGWSKWRLVILPSIIKPLSAAFAFAFALSLGDLGVIALFGSEHVQTLPFLILQRMGSYRTNDAAGLALILCLLTMALMIFADKSNYKKTPENGKT